MRPPMAADPAAAPPAAPAVVLVAPQLGENIGFAARAMLNCGLTDLRLVRPREPWPNPRAWAAASGADRVLDGARVFPTAAEAVADLRHLYATTARSRDMTKPAVTPAGAATEMRQRLAAGEPCGLMFGPERTGLENDEVALADAVLTVPLNPEFTSLNLGQAVLVTAYEWFRAGDATPAREVSMPAETRPATHAELEIFFAHLERELDASGFLRVVEKRPIMVRNLRNLFLRAGLTEKELRALHGVVTSLAGRHRGRH
jgi:tRNA/rRNA methyltransferase